MRWRTFNRLVDRANQVSGEADAAALAGLARLAFFFSWDDAYANVLGEPGIEVTGATGGEEQSLAEGRAIDQTEDAGR